MKDSRSANSFLPIETCRVGVYKFPTDAPESDGTLAWDSTTLVIVELRSGSQIGMGYTYANLGTASTIKGELESILIGADAMDVEARWAEMYAKLRNLGREGISSMAVSAVDVALWDLKAKHLGLPLVELLGARRPAVPVYGSGGFTSYSDAQLCKQFEAWAELGITRFKMKVGREPRKDPERVAAARACIGDERELFVDANSAYTPAQARHFSHIFADEFRVVWLEEPLPSLDFEGLRFLRNHAHDRLEIAEGEYGYNLDYYKRLLTTESVDVAMVDVTRCGGITGFRKISALCEAWFMPTSSHCAPAMHLHPGCASGNLRHVEYFHDHERIERLWFDGVPPVIEGKMKPDLSVFGHGLHFKWADAEPYKLL